MTITLFFSLLFATGAHAQYTGVWTGDAVTADFLDADNWQNQVQPTLNNGTESISFGDIGSTPPTQANPVLSSDYAVANINFLDSTRPSYTFSSPAERVLTLHGDITAAASANDINFDTDLTLSLTTGVHVINTDADFIYINGTVNGAGSLQKLGNGTLVFSSTSTTGYTGGTQVRGGTLSVDGASISHPGNDFLVGVDNAENGTLNVVNGGSIASLQGGIGVNTGSAGTVTIDGAGSVWTNATSLAVGDSGYGELHLSNGGKVTVAGGAGTLTLGSGATGSGYLVIGDIGTPQPGGIVNAAAINTGAGNGTIEFSTDATVGSPYYLTKDGTSTGAGVAITGATEVNIYDGYMVLAGTGSTYTGDTTLYGGALADANAGAFSPNSRIALLSGSIGGLVVNFNETIGGLYDSDGSAPVSIASGATLTINDSIMDNDYTGATISGAGALAKTGPGILTLGGSSSYTGGTTITGGTLNAANDFALGGASVVVSGTGTLLVDEYFLYSASNVQINAGGRLAGNYGGVYAATINAGGTLAPGTALTGSSAIGTLDFEDLTISQNGIFEINVRSDGVGGYNYDQANIQNSATLTINATPANRFTLKLISLNAAYALGALEDLIPGNTYNWLIFDANGIFDVTSGNSTITPGSFLVDDSAFTTTLGGAGLFTVTQTGTDIFLNFTAVPEPSTYALLALGLMGTGFAAWRKRRRT